MVATLNSSHKTVLEHLDVFHRARQCVDEIRDCLWSVLLEVKEEFPTIGNMPLEVIVNRNDNWIGASAFSLASGHNLIGIGLEHLLVQQIIPSALTERCQSYIYSPVLADTKFRSGETGFREALSKLIPPAGFVPSPPLRHGYLFTKPLGHLSIASFCQRSELKTFFMEPIHELVDWLSAVTPTLTALANRGANPERDAI